MIFESYCPQGLDGLDGRVGGRGTSGRRGPVGRPGLDGPPGPPVSESNKLLVYLVINAHGHSDGTMYACVPMGALGKMNLPKNKEL